MKRTDSRAFNFSCIFKNLQRFSMLIWIWNESYPLSSAVSWRYLLTSSNQDQTIQTNISEAKASPLPTHLWHSCPDRDNGLILGPAKAKLCFEVPPQIETIEGHFLKEGHGMPNRYVSDLWPRVFTGMKVDPSVNPCSSVAFLTWLWSPLMVFPMVPLPPIRFSGVESGVCTLEEWSLTFQTSTWVVFIIMG